MSDCKKIAFFDFDGTITTKDTLLEIIRFQKGTLSYYTGFLLHAPWLLAYKLKLIPNDTAKQQILKYFFGGMKEQDFQRACDAFAETRLPHLIRPGALKEIGKLKATGVEMVIVSASAGNWIRKWSDSLSLELVSTTLEIKDAKWNLNEYAEVYAYGDSGGDKPMLALATKSFYKPFRKE